ncbi:hypothetical protein AB0G67_45870, partial [Streptomyces sp. NPDC021056]|uniref:hypothetical protein n=1 Tax=Streptomyces sp. NPDC021056 TaxID=3155012 RepID=UPI0033F497AC
RRTGFPCPAPQELHFLPGLKAGVSTKDRPDDVARPQCAAGPSRCGHVVTPGVASKMQNFLWTFVLPERSFLYGVPVSRIVQLTREHVEERPNGIYIALGAHPVLMPPAVAQLVVAHAGREPRPLVERPHPTKSWLFPGNLADRPTSATPLANRLISYGIAVRRARNSAVLALASDRASSILSEILGVHINTAGDWVRFVKRDRAAFIEARASRLDGSRESR